MGIVFVYMLGQSLPVSSHLAYKEMIAAYDMTDSLATLAMLSGGNVMRQSLFSLGLSPWMTSMIFWRFLSLFKLVKEPTRYQTHLWQMGLLFFVAVIQSYGFSTYQSGAVIEDSWSERLFVMIVMIAGSYVLTWLANLNTKKGLGGPTVIILSNLILTLLMNAYLLKETYSSGGGLGIILFAIMGLFAFIWLTVRVYRAEYRLPIRRLMIVSSLAEKSYLPIRLTPAGGLPFMYAMSLMMLPTLVLSILFSFFPNVEWLQILATQFSIRELPGILFYISLLFVLAIGFSYFHLDPSDIADRMQKNGDFIEGVRPGMATRRYINHYVFRLAIVGAVYTSVVGGLPLLLVWSQSGQVGVALLVNNIYIVTTLMLVIVEQVSVLQTWKQYTDLI